MAGGRNHAPLEQLLDEIKFQRRQVDQPHFCLLRFDMFQKQERAEKLLPRPRIHHRPQHNILDRPLCSAFPLPGGRSELSNQGLFLLLLSLTFTNLNILGRNSPALKYILLFRQTQQLIVMTCSSLSGSARQVAIFRANGVQDVYCSDCFCRMFYKLSSNLKLCYNPEITFPML